MKRKTRNTILIVALAAVMIVLIALVARLYGVGDKKIASPDNLVSIDAIGKANYATQTGNTGYGIEVSVNELGAIKMTGKATGNLEYTVGTVTLTAGKTYTLTSGVSGQSRVAGTNASETGYALVLIDNTTTSVHFADLDGSFTVPTGSAEFTLKIIVLKDTNLGAIGKTFKPVLVEGKKAGTFSTVEE
jgi:hypothetical protein